MAHYDDILLTKTDYQKISDLLSSYQSAVAEALEEELARATVVEDDQLPENVVAMNSTVEFKDIKDGHPTQVTLVYPPDTNIDENKISILSPIGAALIGLRVGQDIQWTLPNGKIKDLKVISVTPKR